MDDQIHPVINVEESIGKTVGKRKPMSASEQAQRVQEVGRRLYKARGFGVCPKGVYRFHSHEEADEWMMKMAIRRATQAEEI